MIETGMAYFSSPPTRGVLAPFIRVRVTVSPYMLVISSVTAPVLVTAGSNVICVPSAIRPGIVKDIAFGLVASLVTVAFCWPLSRRVRSAGYVSIRKSADAKLNFNK